MEYPQEVNPKILWRSDLIWLRYLGSKMFICFLCVCMFIDLFVFYFNHILDTHRNISSKFCEHPTWFGWYIQDIKNVYWFVCLCVCLLTCLFFILIILGHPQEYTLKILWRSDLIWLRYLGSKKMFICLFVCLLTVFFKSSWNTHRNIPWKFWGKLPLGILQWLKQKTKNL